MAKLLAIASSDLCFGEESSVLHYSDKLKKGQRPLVNKPDKLDKRQAVLMKFPFLIPTGNVLGFSVELLACSFSKP